MIAHSELLFSKCSQFRYQGEFIDVRLKVGEDEFPAHRIVLAANSDYFHAMFAHGMKESNQEVIELKDENISVDALKIVMDSIYSGGLHVNDENVFEVLIAADHLQVTSVIQQCCDYLQTKFVQRKFDVQTYCRICMIADRCGLKDLQEATERKMVSMYKEICESEEFLTHMSADQLSSLLSRDDLSAPSENFVFKSVMQWIKYKKEERMAVAAKVIGAVRLGLVDMRDAIRELGTEEMQRMPEIHTLLYQSLLHSYLPSSSTFDKEKAKLRSSGTALVAVVPETQMRWFNVESKSWTPLSSLATAAKVTSCSCTEVIGSKLFVCGGSNAFHCYDIERNAWIDKTASCAATYATSNLCTVGDYMYAIPFNCNQVPQRYSLTEDRWQSFAKVDITSVRNNCFSTSGATVLHSKVYVLYGHRSFQRNERNSFWVMHSAVLHCFDPVNNVWEKKSSTWQSHFGSSLFVVNDKMYVAGGNVSVDDRTLEPCGTPGPVEVYNEANNIWSVVEQGWDVQSRVSANPWLSLVKSYWLSWYLTWISPSLGSNNSAEKHIPSNNLGAVEIEGKVYFIINKFPFDSGIRIPPGEVYPVCLDDWKNLTQIPDNAMLCYLPLKNRDLKAE